MNTKFCLSSLLLVILLLLADNVLAQQTNAPVSSQDDRFLVSGAFRFRNETDADTDYANYRSFSSMRIRTDFSFNARDEGFRVFLQPQFSKNFGEPVVTPTSTTANTSQNTSGTVVDPTFLIHQGYLEYFVEDWSKITLGRQVLSYGDELVIGALDWNTVGRSFDGAKAKVIYSLGWTDLFYAKLVDNNVTTAPTSGDVNFSGIYNSLNFGDYLTSFDIYYFQKDDDSQFVGKKLFAGGVRVSSQFSGFDYRAEYTKEWGSSVVDSEDAYQHDVEIGYKLAEEFLKPRLSVEAFTAGKDYDQLYPTTHKWLGFADVFGRRNIKGTAAHLSLVPLENCTTLVDYHLFERANTDSTAFKTNGSTPIGTTGGSASKDLGQELDITIKYKPSKNMSVSGGYSLFTPGENLRTQFPNKTPEFYFAQVEAVF